MKSKSPLKYVGGKSYMLDDIISIIPPHDTYVEVFGGAGHVFLSKPNSKYNIYNDLNGDLVNLFIQMRDNSEVLMKKLFSTPISRLLFNDYKLIYENKEKYKRLNELDKSIIYFYLMRLSVNGGMKQYNKDSGHTQSSPHMFYSAIKRMTNIKNDYTFECLDFKSCIERYDSENTFFYIDPPYVDCENNYQIKFTEQGHITLSNILKNIKGKFLLSYYPCDLINKLYEGFEISEINKVLRACTDNNKREFSTELLISNYKQVKTDFRFKDNVVNFDEILA